MPKLRLSPTLFLVLEIIILLPSLLFIVGFILFLIFKNPSLYFMVITNNILQNIGVIIISPIASGFLAYQYLERYKPKKLIRLVAKTILLYTIIIIGIVSAYLIFNLFS